MSILAKFLIWSRWLFWSALLLVLVAGLFYSAGSDTNVGAEGRELAIQIDLDIDPVVGTGNGCAGDGDRMLLGVLPAWDRGLTDCESLNLAAEAGYKDSKTKIIVVNVVDILVRLAGLLAVVFLIVAGFRYVLSDGAPDKAAGALKTIIHAGSGLVVAVLGSAIVGIIFRQLTAGSAVDPIRDMVDVPVSAGDLVVNAISFAFLMLGFLSVLMAVLQGIRYALSRGEPQATQRALNGLIYSAVGVAVGLSSWVLVNFVLGRLVISSEPVGILAPIIGFLVMIAGVIAVIMTIIGGFKLTLSGGDPQKAASAQKTIMYAVIGLIVAISAGPLMAWIIGRL